MNLSSKTSIKLKTAEIIHKIIDPNPTKTTNNWQRRADVRRNEIRHKMTNEQKLEMFQAIIDADWMGSLEYTSCMYANRDKKRVIKKRILNERLNKTVKRVKNKTSKAEYQAMLDARKKVA